MFEALIKSFPMAVGIALSAGPILATIMLLMTQKAKVNAPVFLMGWIIGIQIVGSIIIFMPGVIASHGGMSKATGTAKIILGIALLLLILPSLKKKKKQGDKERVPKLFNKLDTLSTIKIFLIGFAFSGLSLKNAALSASGAAHIHTTRLIDYFETLLAVFFFSLIASITIILPIVIYFMNPTKTAGVLLNWRNWLIKNHWNIIITMLFMSGVLLIGIGANIHLS